MPQLMWVLPMLQVLTWVLSYDGEQSPEPLAITAAGAALAVSGNPSLQMSGHKGLSRQSRFATYHGAGVLKPTSNPAKDVCG